MQQSATHINISDDHRISVGVEKVFPFGIAAKNDGLATVGSRQACINKFCIAERGRYYIEQLIGSSRMILIECERAKKRKKNMQFWVWSGKITDKKTASFALGFAQKTATVEKSSTA